MKRCTCNLLGDDSLGQQCRLKVIGEQTCAAKQALSASKRQRHCASLLPSGELGVEGMMTGQTALRTMLLSLAVTAVHK